MMPGQPMNPMMMKLMQMLQQQGSVGYPPEHRPGVPLLGRQGGLYDDNAVMDPSMDMMDQSTTIPQGSDYDLELSEQMGGQPLDYQNQMFYDPEQAQPQGGAMPAGMGYGPIGNRMQRMQATPVHDRETLRRRYPQGIPPDVEGSLSEMEGTSDPTRRYELDDRMHRQMKQHSRSSKFGLRRGLSSGKAELRARDKASISGPGADESMDEVQMLRQELNDLKRSLNKR